MSPKSSYLTDHHREDVQQLQKYLRQARAGLYLLVVIVIANLVLSYRLIAFPCTPKLRDYSPEVCASIIPQPPLVGAHQPIPNEEDWQSHKNEKAGLAVRATVTDIALPESSHASAITEIEERDRYLWFVVAMIGVTLVNQANSWLSIVSSCRDFDQSQTNQFSCVCGAIATAVMYGGAIYQSGVRLGHIQQWMNNNGVQIGGWKRDDVDYQLLQELSDIIGMPVEHLGFYSTPSIDTGDSKNATSAQRRDASASNSRPVFGFTDPRGYPMHFTYLGNTTEGPWFKFGFGNGSAPVAEQGNIENEKRWYGSQYFTWGGIDFAVDFNTADGGILSTTYDYRQLYDEVSCYMSGSMRAAGHWFQVYDNNNKGTITAGRVAPFNGGDHWSGIPQMTNEPLPLAEDPRCHVSRKNR
ncbi:hypothetical protein L228DRAFT_285218 [Xylona heveae TC161]|uniref:Uncharacterized protein n=1 Tax=Xylona heveae (strain CBS 132557 / TC161) TaxID=1328760 RepID=A0A165A136_XYLHT|nr:hypothetical protein L228DRAFT_285218 [Xylona heveae TC161]KZF19806.1 hypothetical protein L228DRAFT_285218 [Xylona heveae TC161]